MTAIDNRGAAAIDTPIPLLLDANTSARYCGISRSKWYTMMSADMVPRPIRVKGSKRWRRDELRDWVDAGCKPWHIWSHMRAEKYKQSE